MCGEHLFPPLVEMMRLGIIPACAGSTRLLPRSAYSSWDHPRMCGEHDSDAWHTPDRQGSSPHVRGARKVRWDEAKPSGIIPACAGSTVVVGIGAGYVRDHPRMCGEHPSG